MRRLKAAIEPALKALGPSPWPLLDRYPFGPVVDGDMLPRHPFDPDATPVSADIPLIIGDTTHEATTFHASDDRVWFGTLTEDELRSLRSPAIAGRHTDRVIALYRQLYPDASPAQRLIATLTDGNFRIRSLRLAERKVQAGRRAGVDVLVRLAHAVVRRPAGRAACAGRAVHLRHAGVHQRHRP